MTSISFKLYLLGTFEARDVADRPVDISAKKNRALLAALALSPLGWIFRERLADLLWSDRADEQARSSLRQSLISLRVQIAHVLGKCSRMAKRFAVPCLPGQPVADNKEAAQRELMRPPNEGNRLSDSVPP